MIRDLFFKIFLLCSQQKSRRRKEHRPGGKMHTVLPTRRGKPSFGTRTNDVSVAVVIMPFTVSA